MPVCFWPLIVASPSLLLRLVPVPAPGFAEGSFPRVLALATNPACRSSPKSDAATRTDSTHWCLVAAGTALSHTRRRRAHWTSLTRHTSVRCSPGSWSWSTATHCRRSPQLASSCTCPVAPAYSSTLYATI
jgi:hypothetical protein